MGQVQLPRGELRPHSPSILSRFNVQNTNFACDRSSRRDSAVLKENQVCAADAGVQTCTNVQNRVIEKNWGRHNHRAKFVCMGDAITIHAKEGRVTHRWPLLSLKGPSLAPF
jgi:hypothetical protein